MWAPAQARPGEGQVLLRVAVLLMLASLLCAVGVASVWWALWGRGQGRIAAVGPALSLCTRALASGQLAWVL